jgi:opacity protein-like surface antigen
MLDYLKLPGSLFFILFASIFACSAQILNEEKTEAVFSEKSQHAEKTKSDRNNANPVAETAPKTEKENQTEQTGPVNWKLRRGKSFSVEYGIAPFNPTSFSGPNEFDASRRDMHLFSFHAGLVIGTKANITYQYMFGVSPLAVFVNNEVANPAFVSAVSTPNIPPTKRETTYGFGFQPVNFKFVFLARNRLKPYAQAGAGLIFTNKAIPVPRATRYNFTGDFGGGLMYMLNPKRAVSVGFRYFHVSNADTRGRINNPGFNAGIFYINYSFLFN